MTAIAWQEYRLRALQRHRLGVCLLAALCGGAITVDAQPAAMDERRSARALPLALQNMPMNRDRRCVGIASVAEALLEGQVTDEAELALSIEQLAKSIFDGLSTDVAIRYPSHIEIQGKRTRITDREALDALSVRVADLYKAEAKRIANSAGGIEKLRAAQDSILLSKRELSESLDVDADKTEVFCCFGYRRFPDGTVKETLHAVVMQKTAQGKITVFDPNDPGKPIACKFRQLGGELVAEWSCEYRNFGYFTSQQYWLVPKSRFFKAARR